MSPSLDIKLWNSATVYDSMSSSKLWQGFSNEINFFVDVGRNFFSNFGRGFSKLVLHGTWYVASAATRLLTFKSLLSIVLATKSSRVLQISRVALWIFVSFVLLQNFCDVDVFWKISTIETLSFKIKVTILRACSLALVCVLVSGWWQSLPRIIFQRCSASFMNICFYFRQFVAFYSCYKICHM